jgi:hypothetical protein
VNIIQFSASANGTRNLGIGGGANLMARNVVSAEDTYTDGLYWMRPWDLTKFGPAGAAVMASNGGKRYFWIWSSDHYDNIYGWNRGSGVHLAFAGDIALPPKVGREIIAHTFTFGGGTWSQLETPYPIWKVEDETDPFWLYCHAAGRAPDLSVPMGQHTVAFKSADLINWTIIGVTHVGTVNQHVGYQSVFRRGENDYGSIGLDGVGVGIWNSTDGETFTKDPVLNGITYKIGERGFGYAGETFLVGAQRYRITSEDARHASLEGGQYVSMVPLDEDLQLPADNSGVIRISSEHEGTYPGPKYLQHVDCATEDGIAHVFAKRAFFADAGIVGGADYGDGGGYDDQIVDYYSYVFDETTARTSAPAGVRASVSGGVVTLRWYDALPQITYVVYRDTDPELATKTLVGNVNGVSTTDTPGGTGTYYYEVVTLDGESEEGSRVVSPYVSSRSALVNAHVERALAAGVPIDTIDLDHLAWAEDVLDELGIKNDLLHWVMPEFGHIKDESNVLSKCFCLGSTLKPRGGDLTFATSNSIYSATGWNGRPAWTASTGAAQSYFGSGVVNNVRRARNTGLTLIGSIQRAGTSRAMVLNWGEFNGYYLEVASGSPGVAGVGIANGTGTYDIDTHATTLANGSAHIIGGVITSTTAKIYVEGSPGSGVARAAATSLTDQLNGSRGGIVPVLGQGSLRSKMSAAASSATRVYTFSDNQANFASRDLIVVKRALTDEQMGALNTYLRAGP